ncbi:MULTISPECIES: hypothetical protein [Pseudoalteromonas]|uniref:Orphan protein n=1 Tax=Pseudoalteromonas haloplanktis TaxID=228 RepID=A0ABU1B7A7_PSEHA|nr:MULTISPECIES: hypothetical protein [Pseudoalteromonas]MCF6146349.1 hypothetical protein [Pseudoalteromonas mariniglutinosa NCIMB 1770]MDQ9090298.1 hypothetical protein [Pseudoalteromonas haloplanktis]TMN71681.1 hypothetical protein CWB85_10085 [Pseudoalteromonas sp. S1727]
MNTLLLSILLLSPNEVQLTTQVKLQTTEAIKVIQAESATQLKKQIADSLENMELTLPIIVDQQTLAKVHTVQKQLSQD